MFALKPFQSTLTFFVCLAAVNCGIFVWGWLSPSDISNENGPIENLQVVVLGLSFLTYAHIFSKQENAAQTLAGFLCLLCASLLLKELDFRELMDPALVEGSYWNENTQLEKIRKLLKWFGFLLFPVLLISRIRHIPSVVRAAISWRSWPFFLCVSLLVLGQALEIGGFRNPEGLTGVELVSAAAEFKRFQAIERFWEELSELNGHLVLLYAAQSRAVISCLISARGKK